ncbi:MAG: caspase family protein [Planctomycetes bacterium]|nr:caspase family protein [Planctomycetota bacterium]
MWLVAAICGFGQAQDDAELYGRIPEDSASRYRKQWALIVGVNYDGRSNELTEPEDRLALPRLRNAEHDARELANILTQFYGFQEGAELSDQTTLTCRLGGGATFAAIDEQLAWLLRPENVSAEDGVLVFFAGHGVKIPDDRFETSAIFPYDVQLSRGRPTSREIRLHTYLLNKLQHQCAARHKLMILDACYSGEIFKRDFQSSIRNDDRTSDALFQEPAFQAIASCRAFQVASDGSGINSPFTEHLVRSLQQLPARDDVPRAITTHQLFRALWSDMKSLPGNQEPECRNLAGDGEFRFMPSAGADFSEFRPKLDETKLLQATITGEQGDWWFDDMPWFIPSLRVELLKSVPATRDPGFALVPKEALLAIAQQMVVPQTPASKEAEPTYSLPELRRRHARRLLENHKRRQFVDVLREIVAELEARSSAHRGLHGGSNGAATAVPPGDSLAAEDLHMLALAHHALRNKEQAMAAYRQAVAAYEAALTPASTLDSTARSNTHKAFLALCRADQAQFLLDVAGQPKEAAELFHAADMLFSNSAPQAFRVFVLCRESDAWLQLNRWAEANDRLEQAIALAESVNPAHFLTADTHRRQAWAHMIQWQIRKAQQSFLRSNSVLVQSLGGAQRPAADRDAPPQTGSIAAPTKADPPAPSLHVGPLMMDVIRQSGDYRAKVVYFHNQHGLAMAERFLGAPAEAIHSYRWLTREVENAISDLQQVEGDVAADTEVLLYERLVNTLERLGDCNLFGPPAQRDLREAFDDYRRAMGLLHHLSSRNRDGLQAGLFYKQGLALAMAAILQEHQQEDLQLALRMCTEADEICSRPAVVRSGLLAGLNELVTPIVKLIAQKHVVRDDNATESAVVALRGAIQQFRENHGPTLHRDQLELCLLASKVLLECGCESDRFYIQQDSALLLSFCRMALAPFYSDAVGNVSVNSGETRLYVRPYYDAAFRAQMTSSTADVKQLVELQWEAIHGTRYVKPEVSQPILALYVLGNTPYLFADLPGANSKIIALADEYQIDELTAACQAGAAPIALPREVIRQLAHWRETHGQRGELAVNIVCLGEDPEIRMDGQVRYPKLVTSELDATGATKKSQFPFILPEGFVRSNSAEGADVASSVPPIAGAD